MHDRRVAAYLASRGITAPWGISGCGNGSFAGAVIIPALAESANLFATLHSLAKNPADFLSRFLVLVVVNHREDACASDKADNRVALGMLAGQACTLGPLNLAWVDAASPGLDLPAKGGGVGMARKIGHDLALKRLDFDRCDPLLISLDADTLVEPSYLPAIAGHFADSREGGAVIPFRHRDGATAGEHAAILRYELFLRGYVLGLALAGSPYAFHTVGSAMACRASAYLRMGGMNTRVAGEDFYFLQHLYKTAGVSPVKGSTVFPSPRRSHRVPFGTGRSVSRLLDGDDGAVLFYRPDCFRILGKWLELARGAADCPAEEVMARAAEISPHCADFLQENNFVEVWGRLRRNNRDDGKFMTAFHCWFDGLKTMKLVHHLSAGPFPRCGPEEALPPLLERAGIDTNPCEPVIAGKRLLEILRKMQGSEN